MLLVARLVASNEQAWEPMAPSGVNLCQKTRTVHCTSTGLPGKLQLAGPGGDGGGDESEDVADEVG
jgi:hypothetical protein